MLKDKKMQNKLYCKEYYQRNKDVIKKRTGAYQKSHREQTRRNGRKNRLKFLYGIQLDEYNRMLVNQENKCAMCDNVFLPLNDICVDHDHISGMIRELLCRKCNVGLGHFNDDQAVLAKAITYIAKWNKK